MGDAAPRLTFGQELWATSLQQHVIDVNVSGRAAWIAWLEHIRSANGSKPSPRWLKNAEQRSEAVGAAEVSESVRQWLSQAGGLGRGAQIAEAQRLAAQRPIIRPDAQLLRGLIWSVLSLPEPVSFAHEVAGVALASFRKIPGAGARSTSVGNAAIYVLSQINSVDVLGQLMLLKQRIKAAGVRKAIERALATLAERLDVPAAELEELAAPTYGLGADGTREQSVGDYRARLAVVGTRAELCWTDSGGKRLKSVPASVRRDHADELKELQQALKDVQGMLPALRDRIDAMFLAQRSWPVSVWRRRYLEHPLVGVIASRLIWSVDGEAALFRDGVATDVKGRPIAHGQTAEITLWHPVGCSVDEIIAWRRRLESLEVVQPFKQAHREVYLLTDAERRTGNYSNRFAAHVIRQHQFHALCAARGWRNRLRLMVDDVVEPPLRELPAWGLRAEFWVEGLGHDYGVDVNEAGVYLRLATDQVRFYRMQAPLNHAHALGGGYVSESQIAEFREQLQPLELENVPPLVFSEIMRDVDLFVGVSSIGNDPTWQDGGPEGRFLDYWQSYSFGALTGSATTRKEALERIVPRLKIASRCSFGDRFLIVRGDLRTYKIHLGSGNILMEPNDQYLCIVPDARSQGGQSDLYLPFEGDRTLSIILSKAMLLAADTRITDSTITSQIRAR